MKELAAATSTRGFVQYLLKHLTDGLGRFSEKSRSLSKRSRTGQNLGLIDFLWKLYMQEYTINHASLSLLSGKVPWICFPVKITPLNMTFYFFFKIIYFRSNILLKEYFECILASQWGQIWVIHEKKSQSFLNMSSQFH